ncbi:hypothetical protein ACFL1R_07480 [Candidatus Latescibacterota bacterium]
MLCIRVFSYALIALVMLVPGGRCNPIYSANGIGIIIQDEGGRSSGMGGAGIAYDDGNNLLRGNPALLSSFKDFTYFLGAYYDHNTAFTGGSESPTFAKTTPHLLKLVIPLYSGIVIGWGMTPYSKTDSVIEFESGDKEEYTDKLISSGGINISSVSIAGSYRDIIRLGFSLNYNFGVIKEEWSRAFSLTDNIHNSTYFINKKYKGYSTTFGMIARVFKQTRVGIGYTGKADLEKSVHVRPGDSDNPEKIYPPKTVSIPTIWRFGITSGFGQNITASIDYSRAGWEQAAHGLKEKEMYNNTYDFCAGIRVIPSQDIYASYFTKLPISAGFRAGTVYYKSYPKTDIIAEKAVTFGIEFPLREDSGSIITTFEIGTRGEKGKNGWDETFTRIGLVLIGKVK